MTELAAAAVSAPRRVPVTLAALFSAFLQVSLLGFGAGLAWAHRLVVERRRWIEEPEFADIVSLCQFMPGPNIVGIAVCVGASLRGWRGTLAALCGFLVIPGALGFALGISYLELARAPALQNILAGVSAVAAGLFVATGLRLLLAYRRQPAAILFAALAFIGMVFVKLPLIIVLFGLMPLSMAAAAIARTSAR